MACAVCGIRRRQFQKPARAFSVGACGDTNLRYTPCYRPTQRDATLRRRAATRVRVVGERKSRRAKRVNESSLNFVSGRRADCLFGLGRAVARARNIYECVGRVRRSASALSTRRFGEVTCGALSERPRRNVFQPHENRRARATPHLRAWGEERPGGRRAAGAR